jgi:uncharacterized membrane protein YeiH
VTCQGILAAGITIGGFKWTGNLTLINLIAATTNALNGALLARRPDHYKNFTVVGILLMALLGGIGGGVTRDVLLNQIPGAFLNPAYIVLCLAAGVVRYLIAFSSGQLFREGLFQFMTAFSLPWYAIAGAQAAKRRTCPSWGCWRWRSSARPRAATTSTSPAACRRSSSSAANGS